MQLPGFDVPKDTPLGWMQVLPKRDWRYRMLDRRWAVRTA